eukprot:801504-Amphidinium_carterae.1
MLDKQTRLVLQAPGSSIHCVVTDSITAVNPDPELIQQCRDNTTRKIDFDMIGEWKLESEKSIKGQPLSVVMSKIKEPVHVWKQPNCQTHHKCVCFIAVAVTN